MVSLPPTAANGNLSSQTFKILVLPGDHAGPEVMTEALKVLSIIQNALPPNIHFELSHDIVGGISIDTHGTPITDDVLAKASRSDAVLFGSVGGPEWGTTYPNPESGLLRLRQHINGAFLTSLAFANIRPCMFYSESLLQFSPLKPEVARGTNFIVLRENCGGAYFGPKKEEASYASDTWEYSAPEIERCCHVAAALARTLGRDDITEIKDHSSSLNKSIEETPAARVISSDKANVLASSRLWRKVTTEVFATSYPSIKLTHHLADSLSMVMMKDPRSLNGIIHTDNTFGDMLSDQAGGVVGTLGTLPSASLCGIPGQPGESQQRCNGIYEPVHGSAPDISGKSIVNPIAQILSLALLLRYTCDMHDFALAIERSVRKVLDAQEIGGLEIRTADLGGTNSTVQVGDAVCRVLKDELKSLHVLAGRKLGSEKPKAS